MLETLVLIFLLMTGVIVFTITLDRNSRYPVYKIKQLKQRSIVKCNLSNIIEAQGNQVKYFNYSWEHLPLGQLGILTNEFVLDTYRSCYLTKVILPVLTDSRELTFSSVMYRVTKEPPGFARSISRKWLQNNHIHIEHCWYSSGDICGGHIPVLDQLDSQDKIRYKTAQELAPLIQEHYKLKSEIARIDSERESVKKLFNLIDTSNVYANQQQIYETAYLEMGELLSKAQELEQLYNHLIRDALIGVKLATNYLTMQPESHFAIEAIKTQHEKQKEEYEYLKDKVAAYGDLLNRQF